MNFKKNMQNVLANMQKALEKWNYKNIKAKLADSNKSNKSDTNDTKPSILTKDSDFIVVQNINFSYKKNIQTLKNVSFTIKKGDFRALVGANGSGKSTTIKILTKLMKIQSGNIFINGTDLYSLTPDKLRVVYIPDKAIFPHDLSLFEYLYNELNLFSNNTKYLKKDIDNWLKKFELIDHKNKNPNRLSSGQKKKVEMIRAILYNPDLIILDEPAANLDPVYRNILFNTLKQFNERGCTILISSHILYELKEYVNSATIISNGVVQYSGDVSGNQLVELFNKFNDQRIEIND